MAVATVTFSGSDLMILATLILLAIGSYALKASGPLLLGGDRELPPLLRSLTLLLPAPLLAALVATSTFVNDQRWIIDERAIGLAVAAVALWRRLPFIVVIVLAAAATAAARFVIGS